MKIGEDILAKLCLRKNETTITISIAIKKGKGTGISERAANTSDKLLTSLQVYVELREYKLLHCKQRYPEQTKQ